uniref:Uncharacterized protein n=1 Tax=Anguilla anguilla TaxID=7936 RepID=A0A0E9W151_ANGAN
MPSLYASVAGHIKTDNLSTSRLALEQDSGLECWRVRLTPSL